MLLRVCYGDRAPGVITGCVKVPSRSRTHTGSCSTEPVDASLGAAVITPRLGRARRVSRSRPRTNRARDPEIAPM